MDKLEYYRQKAYRAIEALGTFGHDRRVLGEIVTFLLSTYYEGSLPEDAYEPYVRLRFYLGFDVCIPSVIADHQEAAMQCKRYIIKEKGEQSCH